MTLSYVKPSELAVLLTLIIFSSQSHASPDIVLVTPNVLQSDTTQSVLVSTNGADPVSVTITIEDGRYYQYLQAGTQNVDKRSPQIFKFTVPCKDIPVHSGDGIRFVYVRAVCNAYRWDRKVRVALSCKASSVFIQTDKPVYTTEDIVNIRIVVVDTNLKPQFSEEVTVDIKNPDGIIVDRINLESDSNPVIKKYQLHLGPTPVEGIYTIVAKYGFKQESVSEFHFEVKDYVLPRFDVQIVPPNYVTNDQKPIKIKFIAKYTYGKGVVGNLDVKIGICQENSTKILRFFENSFQMSSKGEKEIFVPKKGYNVFPLGERMCIVAEVTERASGIKQSSSDSSAFFTDAPVKLDCDLSPPFYRPRLTLDVTVRARYPDGRVVKGVSVTAIIKGQGGNPQKRETSEDGLATIALNVGNPSGNIGVIVKRAGDDVGTECIFQKFQSGCGSNGAQLSIQSREGRKLEVGKNADFRLATVDTADQTKCFVVVLISRGVIQGYKTFEGNSADINFQIPITASLANKFCLLAYFTDSCGALVADQTCVETTNVFENNIKLNIKSEGRGHVRPGEKITLTVKAANKSDVALLAVDKSLYILNNENKLTQNQVFDELKNFDKSCGYANSGVNTRDVFEATGLAAVSKQGDVYSYQRSTLDCPKNNRNRRSSSETDSSCLCKFGKSVVNSIVDTNSGVLQPESKVLLAKKCDELYKNTAPLKAECGSVETYDDFKMFLDCCLSPLGGSDGRARNAPSPFNDITEVEDSSLIQRRTYFPHSWLWDLNINTGDHGTWSKLMEVPDSITKWIFHGLALSTKDGFGVAEPVELEVFKNIFVECHLPYSFRRQEQVSVACTVYNYNAASERVCLRLLDPPEDLCTTAGMGKQTDNVCEEIESYDTLTVLLPILPLKTGQTQFTVQVRTQFGGDEVVQEIRVEPEGVLREYDYSNELDPQGSNLDDKCGAALSRQKRQAVGRGVCYTVVKEGRKCGQRLLGEYTKDECCDNQIVQSAVAWGDKCELCPRTRETRDNLIPGIPGGIMQTNRYYIRVPENHIDGSVSAWLGVTGRYLEANIKPISGIEDLLRVPGGCGEQSLIRFGPNVAIVKYLKATGNLPPERGRVFLDLIKRGYVYQQRYRTDSGGFTVWKSPHYKASTWLSAFALRTFCAARDLIFVDNNIIVGILDFLVDHQHDTGEFYENYRVHHAEMVGGVQGGDVSLTAYVAVSMLECCNSSNDHSFTQRVRNGICKAIKYLKQRAHDGQVNRPYSQALAFFALSKACTCCRVCQAECQPVDDLSAARHRLELQATNEQCSMHWEADTELGNAYWYHRPSAISVEISAYALCAYVCEGGIDRARSIARWLNGQRNSRGAFACTQDTVVALTCLGEFAKHIDVKHSLTVNVTALHDKSFHKEFHITNDNYELQQRIEVPINDVLTAVTIGDGLGLAQVHVEYNTPATTAEECAFDFNVTAELVDQEQAFGNGKEATIGVCVKHLGVNCTGMAIVNVEHLTGFRPCEKRPNNVSDIFCLKDMIEENLIPGLSRYEITGRSVVFYFDEICPTEPLCFKFNTIEEFEVKHQVPVSAEVYDYYKQEIQCTKFFSLGSGSPKLSVICSDNGNQKDPLCVCGAGRCPKLEPIDDRLCSACARHNFVYKIQVINQQYENGWIKYRVVIVEELKPGARRIEPNSKKILWLPSICEQSVTLEDGKEYHLQGMDGPKFVLDHSSHIEPWPPSFDDCVEKETIECLKDKCSQIKNAGKRKTCNKSNEKKCKDKVKRKCNDSKKFDKYVSQLKEGGACEDCR